jgi:hypothetical protein
MIRTKGIAEAVEAVRRSRGAGAPVELHLLGDPDPANPRSIPQATLEGWSAAPGVAWHGRVAGGAGVWREHHIAMLLSYREGLPRSLVEAAAVGRRSSPPMLQAAGRSCATARRASWYHPAMSAQRRGR